MTLFFPFWRFCIFDWSLVRLSVMMIISCGMNRHISILSCACTCTVVCIAQALWSPWWWFSLCLGAGLVHCSNGLMVIWQFLHYLPPTLYRIPHNCICIPYYYSLFAPHLDGQIFVGWWGPVTFYYSLLLKLHFFWFLFFSALQAFIVN